MARRHANALPAKAAQIRVALRHHGRNLATRSAHALEASNPITQYRQSSRSPAARRVYTSMFRARQWHGVTRTHFPPRPRKSAWRCDIANAILPHVLPTHYKHHDVAHHLWAYSGTTFFAGRFFHIGWSRLAELLTEMEKTALLPVQTRYTNIGLIPKNERVERPIALTSCLYRLWNRYRKFELQQWQMGLDRDMPWDQARPHRDCLSIAVGRMLKAEIGKHQGVYTVSCLADPAMDLHYPPLHLKLALRLPLPN